MTRPPRLSDAEVESGLAELHGWSVANGKLHRELRFADFREAFAFMTAVALAAEKADHHPEWSNVWASVRIDLATHDVGGITKLDFELARAIDAAARGRTRENPD